MNRFREGGYEFELKRVAKELCLGPTEQLRGHDR